MSTFTFLPRLQHSLLSFCFPWLFGFLRFCFPPVPDFLWSVWASNSCSVVLILTQPHLWVLALTALLGRVSVVLTAAFWSCLFMFWSLKFSFDHIWEQLRPPWPWPTTRTDDKYSWWNLSAYTLIRSLLPTNPWLEQSSEKRLPFFLEILNSCPIDMEVFSDKQMWKRPHPITVTVMKPMGFLSRPYSIRHLSTVPTTKSSARLQL